MHGAEMGVMNHAATLGYDPTVLKIGEKGQNTWERCRKNRGPWLMVGRGGSETHPCKEDKLLAKPKFR